MIRILIFVLVTGCESLGYTLPDDELVENDEIPDEELLLAPVESMHWACCSDLCKGWKYVKSVLNEAETKYIRCNCKNGKQFRVTRTRAERKRKK